MSAWPDIVVTQPDSPEVQLAVEVKVGPDSRASEAHIKGYMVRQNCPLGMLVTPGMTLFFRNPYTGYEPEAIRKVGECRTEELLGAIAESAAGDEEVLLEGVEHWLEGLPLNPRRSWPSSAQEAIESYLLPAVMGGVVRATGPRWRRTAS